VDVCGRQGERFAAYATERGARRIVWPQGEAYILQCGKDRHLVSAEALLEEAATWTS